MTKKTKFSYICPYCKGVQDTIREWDDASIGYDYNIATQEYKEYKTIFRSNKEYTCPDCKRNIPYDLIKKFY